MRSDGFYVVRRHDRTFAVAEWRDGFWRACGDSHCFDDSQWLSIGRKLEVGE